MFGKYFFTDQCNPNIKTLTPNGSGGYSITNLGTLGGSNLVSFGEDVWGETTGCIAGQKNMLKRLRAIRQPPPQLSMQLALAYIH